MNRWQFAIVLVFLGVTSGIGALIRSGAEPSLSRIDDALQSIADRLSVIEGRQESSTASLVTGDVQGATREPARDQSAVPRSDIERDKRLEGALVAAVTEAAQRYCSSGESKPDHVTQVETSLGDASALASAMALIEKAVSRGDWTLDDHQALKDLSVLMNGEQLDRVNQRMANAYTNGELDSAQAISANIPLF